MYGLKFGYDIINKSMTDSLGVEGTLNYFQTKSKTDDSSVRGYLVRVDAIYPFVGKRVVPFLAIGVGGMFTDGTSVSDKVPFLNYGAGLKYFFEDYLAFRVDVRHLLLYQDAATRNNVEFTAGLSYYFGKESKKKPAPLPEQKRKEQEQKEKGRTKPGKKAAAGGTKETAQAPGTVPTLEEIERTQKAEEEQAKKAAAKIEIPTASPAPHAETPEATTEASPVSPLTVLAAPFAILAAPFADLTAPPALPAAPPAIAAVPLTEGTTTPQPAGAEGAPAGTEGRRASKPGAYAHVPVASVPPAAPAAPQARGEEAQAQVAPGAAVPAKPGRAEQPAMVTVQEPEVKAETVAPASAVPERVTAPGDAGAPAAARAEVPGPAPAEVSGAPVQVSAKKEKAGKKAAPTATSTMPHAAAKVEAVPGAPETGAPMRPEAAPLEKAAAPAQMASGIEAPAVSPAAPSTPQAKGQEAQAQAATVAAVPAKPGRAEQPATVAVQEYEVKAEVQAVPAPAVPEQVPARGGAGTPAAARAEVPGTAPAEIAGAPVQVSAEKEKAGKKAAAPTVAGAMPQAAAKVEAAPGAPETGAPGQPEAAPLKAAAPAAPAPAATGIEAPGVLPAAPVIPQVRAEEATTRGAAGAVLPAKPGRGEQPATVTVQETEVKAGAQTVPVPAAPEQVPAPGEVGALAPTQAPTPETVPAEVSGAPVQVAPGKETVRKQVTAAAPAAVVTVPQAAAKAGLPRESTAPAPAAPQAKIEAAPAAVEAVVPGQPEAPLKRAKAAPAVSAPAAAGIEAPGASLAAPAIPQAGAAEAAAGAAGAALPAKPGRGEQPATVAVQEPEVKAETRAVPAPVVPEVPAPGKAGAPAAPQARIPETAPAEVSGAPVQVAPDKETARKQAAAKAELPSMATAPAPAGPQGKAEAVPAPAKGAAAKLSAPAGGERPAAPTEAPAVAQPAGPPPAAAVAPAHGGAALVPTPVISEKQAIPRGTAAAAGNEPAGKYTRIIVLDGSVQVRGNAPAKGESAVTLTPGTMITVPSGKAPQPPVAAPSAEIAKAREAATVVARPAGVPAERGRQPVCREVVRKLTVEFDFGSSSVKPKYRRQLKKLADLMNASPGSTARVEGYTDNIGKRGANMLLSRKRVESVKASMVDFGADPARIVAQGFGPSRPIADNATATGRQRNRRAEATVTVVICEPAGRAAVGGVAVKKPAVTGETPAGTPSAAAAPSPRVSPPAPTGAAVALTAPGAEAKPAPPGTEPARKYTKIIGLEGTVEIRGSSPAQGKAAVTLTPGTMTVVRSGQAPSSPVAASADEMRKAGEAWMVEGAPSGKAAAPEARKPVARKVVRKLTVEFDNDSSYVKPVYSRQLKKIAEIMNSAPGSTAKIVGHTDSVGNRYYNFRLSKQRAESVKRSLATFGVDPARITTRGYGPSQPIADNATPQGRQKNRRAVTTVTVLIYPAD